MSKRHSVLAYCMTVRTQTVCSPRGTLVGCQGAAVLLASAAGSHAIPAETGAEALSTAAANFDCLNPQGPVLHGRRPMGGITAGVLGIHRPRKVKKSNAPAEQSLAVPPLRSQHLWAVRLRFGCLPVAGS